MAANAVLLGLFSWPNILHDAITCGIIHQEYVWLLD